MGGACVWGCWLHAKSWEPAGDEGREGPVGGLDVARGPYFAQPCFSLASVV